jgi:hypothetical protein
VKDKQRIVVPDGVAAICNVMCGCGNPEVAWQAIRNYLDMTSGDKDHWYDAATGEQWMFIYLMDHLGLTEHGGGVRGAWITKKGEEVLLFLETHGAGWQDKDDVEFYSKDEVWLNPCGG